MASQVPVRIGKVAEEANSQMGSKGTSPFRLRRSRLDKAARHALGEGVPTNLARAVRLYQLESKAGSGEASYNLATMYARGEGVRKSWAAANKLFRLAEDQGSPDASLVLGDMKLKRVGATRKNAQDAISHFAIAALRGDRRGLRSIADAIVASHQLRVSDIARALEHAFHVGTESSKSSQSPSRKSARRTRSD